MEAFAEISGDKGVHHVKPDSKGRIMVQGLLTASAPTKLGGDVDYIAREIRFEFIRPVYVGDTITSEALCTKADPGDARLYVSFEITCRNQNGQEVLRARTSGVIRL